MNSVFADGLCIMYLFATVLNSRIHICPIDAWFISNLRIKIRINHVDTYSLL